MTEFSETITIYIAGFVVHSMLKRLKCAVCVESLQQDPNNLRASLIAKKNRGSLTSNDVIKVVQKCESEFKNHMDRFENTQTHHKITQTVLKSFINTNILTSHSRHYLDYPICANHRVLLLKSIVFKYIQMRLFYYYKRKNTPQCSTRKQLTKLIHFQGY